MGSRKARETVRAISLWQPWADLVARELKEYETRHWPCQQFGPIAIHAAKRKFRDEEMSREARTQMLMDEVDPFQLKYGVIVCIAEIVSCQSVESIRERLSPRELLYGNYEDGRFAWRIANVQRLKKPIEVTGHQGFFFWKEARTALAEAGL